MSSFQRAQRPTKETFIISVIAVILAVGFAGLLAMLNGTHPIRAYKLLVEGGFSCQSVTSCNLLGTLQFTTPLILTGLSAAAAFRSGLFSLGQAGQMLLGAAAAGTIGSNLEAGNILHPALALLGGGVVGALWGFIPGILKAWLGVNEAIATLIMNQLAPLLIGFFSFQRVAHSARLPSLAPNSKLNPGLFLAFFVLGILTLHHQKRTSGYEEQMFAEAPKFAAHGGISSAWTTIRAMILSGGLAGLAGAVETLGVHYRLVTAFSGGGNFDGIAVAMLGQLNPIGIGLSAFLLAGIRVGTLHGLQLKAQIPRELGGAMLAMIMCLVSIQKIYQRGEPFIRKLIGGQSASDRSSRG